MAQPSTASSNREAAAGAALSSEAPSGGADGARGQGASGRHDGSAGSAAAGRIEPAGQGSTAARGEGAPPGIDGVVESLFVAARAGAPMEEVAEVRALAGRGLEGDRYAEGTGIASHKRNKPREVTLIEAEAIEAVVRDCAVELRSRETRRNILVRGVALNHLVGREFTVGAARLLGHELCEPCGYLESLTRAGVRAALVHRGGLRCAILADGVIRRGDRVRA
ncbi:MAG TPA: hypothetical protein PKC43_02490 [Phycisphaerales bacterium]|nr:hypothetical protein [Phycisphaerales bacterium]HMP36294.1 hypothetical protein [Phycisphaerales bacterium]